MKSCRHGSVVRSTCSSFRGLRLRSCCQHWMAHNYISSALSGLHARANTHTHTPLPPHSQTLSSTQTIYINTNFFKMINLKRKNWLPYQASLGLSMAHSKEAEAPHLDFLVDQQALVSTIKNSFVKIYIHYL